jgi:hypothetical protein
MAAFIKEKVRDEEKNKTGDVVEMFAKASNVQE